MENFFLYRRVSFLSLPYYYDDGLCVMLIVLILIMITSLASSYISSFFSGKRKSHFWMRSHGKNNGSVFWDILRMALNGFLWSKKKKIYGGLKCRVNFLFFLKCKKAQNIFLKKFSEQLHKHPSKFFTSQKIHFDVKKILKVNIWWLW